MKSIIKHGKRHHFCSRKGSKWVFLGEFEGMTLFGTKAQVYYKTAVKVQSAGVLRTRVRATVVFQNSISKKRPSCEHVCKVSRFRNRFSNFARLLQCFLKALQNRSEKLKTTFPRTQFWVSVGFYSAFQTATHRKYYKTRYFARLGNPRAQRVDKNNVFFASTTVKPQ